MLALEDDEKLEHRMNKELKKVYAPFAYCTHAIGFGDRKVNLILL